MSEKAHSLAATGAFNRVSRVSATAKSLLSGLERGLFVWWVHLQEHIELGRHSAEAVRAAVFGPAIADFDALLLLRRDSLPWADRAAQPAKVHHSSQVESLCTSALSPRRSV